MIGTGIGLGLAGYRLNPPGVLPVLDLRFATDKSLTAFAGPTPSFSRASSGTYFDANGVLQSAGVNAARFNHVYNGTSWVSRGLLVEEQRTNAFQWSEDFSNAFWTKLNAAIATSSGTSPDGTNTANKITDDSTNGTHRIYRGNVGTADQPCTTSFYLKAGTARYAIVLNSDNNDWRAYAVADLQTGTITQNGVMVATTGASYIGSSITNCGDGWYRVSVSGTNRSGDANYYGQVALSNSATPGTIPSYVGTGSYIYAVMAQMELNSSFPTSYIKTTSSTVTRSADVCQITGGDFSGFWNQSEGTFAAECDVNGFNASGVNYIGVASVGSISQYAFVGRFNGSLTSLNFQAYNGSPFGDITYAATSATPTKTAFGIKANDCAASVNGGAVSTDNTVTMTTALNQLEIGNFLGANHLNGHIACLRYYRTRLENGTLRVLST